MVLIPERVTDDDLEMTRFFKVFCFRSCNFICDCFHKFFLNPNVGENRDESSSSGCRILSLSFSVCPTGSDELSEDIVVCEGYAASVAQDSLPAGAAERKGMVEVPVCFADRTAGFLSVDAFFFKSGHFHYPLVR